MEIADQAFYLTKSQYTDIKPATWSTFVRQSITLDNGNDNAGHDDDEINDDCCITGEEDDSYADIREDGM